MSLSADIIVVGAGVAGTTAAAVLGKQGQRVVLVDPRERFAPVLRSEKMEGAQVALLRKFGLLEALLPHAGPAHEVWSGYNGRVFKKTAVEQYGFSYADLVNAFRGALPSTVTTVLDQVKAVRTSSDLQRVMLADGQEWTARLVVLACGLSDSVQTALGVKRRLIQKNQCTVFGFHMAAPQKGPLPFEGLTYFPTTARDDIDFLVIFPFPKSTRANLFSYRSPTDDWVKTFLRQPDEQLRRAFPKLSAVTGPLHVVGKVDVGSVDLYATESPAQAGVVLIGDTFQSACPATGLGMLKSFTDVDVLAEHIPRWMQTPGMGRDKIETFYNDPRKKTMDQRVLKMAYSQRTTASSRALKTRLRRLFTHLQWQFARPRGV